jgi:6-pyruvoyl-tetrahydropterin synthase
VIAVARRYQFNARHRVEGLPEPWCDTHAHRYTVEVVCESHLAPEESIVIDTDVLDAVGYGLAIDLDGQDLNDATPTDTTVESLAIWMLGLFGEVADVREVTVWEDYTRWGRARR